MNLFSKLFGFGGSGYVTVRFVDESTDVLIGITEIQPNELPENFEAHTTVEFKNSEWSVSEAIPKRASEFRKTRNLTLKVRKIEMLSVNDLLFTLATVSNELPENSVGTIHQGPEVVLREDDWRQIEFLNPDSRPLIDIEVKAIRNVWENNSKGDADFTAFTNCHIRKTIGSPELIINLQTLKSLLGVHEIGSLKIMDQFVSDGFSLATTTTTFYGIAKGNIVNTLCLANYRDNSSSDITKIKSHFGLLFINWYIGSVE